MCSAAWRFTDDGYELGFNRDEKWTRSTSAHPTLETIHPVAGVCARDTGAGGTWLFTNEYGITLAVMNSYPDGYLPVAGRCSRGLIPFLAATSRTPREVEESLWRVPWPNYSPCTILLISPEETRHYAWDLTLFSSLEAPVRNFLTSSSVDSKEVNLARIARYEALASASLPEILNDTFASGTKLPSAIFVTREDAGTVSQTLVKVTSNTIEFSVRRRGENPHEISFPRKP